MFLNFSTDCEQMDIEIPKFTFLEEIKKDLEEYESNYLLYENFRLIYILQT